MGPAGRRKVAPDYKTLINLIVGQEWYTINSQAKTMDVAPMDIDPPGRVFVPVRFVADALGAEDIGWDQATKTVTVSK